MQEGAKELHWIEQAGPPKDNTSDREARVVNEELNLLICTASHWHDNLEVLAYLQFV